MFQHKYDLVKIVLKKEMKSIGMLIKRCLLGVMCLLVFPAIVSAQEDWRNIVHGDIIPDEAYSDQPYVVQTDDGAWLCIMTTGAGHEGVSGQHIITWRSEDQGKTWIDKQELEPADGPEASYAVMVKAPSGRVFAFYNHNTDNIRSIIGNSPPYKNGVVKRVDSQGYFVMKYSDDHGKSWSEKRYTLPVRNFEIDKNNVYKGDIQFFWNVGKPFVHEKEVFVPIIKVGGFGEGFFTSNEGALLMSPDLFDKDDPDDATWVTLPEGEVGLRTPRGGGPIAGEQSYTVLSDGTFFSVYRTIDGYPAHAYSYDNGRNWTAPEYLRYADGRLVKHPRAANFVWKCENGKYLYWYHNHGGRYIATHPGRRSMGYQDRNPVWILGGIEEKGPKGNIIKWSQPEILFYDDDPIVRMSYPDMVEENGQIYFTETQKDIARVHKVDMDLLEKLWSQFDDPQPAADDMLSVDLPNPGKNILVPAPPATVFYERDRHRVDGGGRNVPAGFTVEFALSLDEVVPGDKLLSTIDEFGRGWSVTVVEDHRLQIQLTDGRTKSVWSSDKNTISAGGTHFFSIIIDGGPKVISFVSDGLFNDGGAHRQFGWGRFNPFLHTIDGSDQLHIASELHGSLSNLKIYNRAIKHTEAIGNYREFMTSR